jgi:hypothetical protein
MVSVAITGIISQKQINMGNNENTAGMMKVTTDSTIYLDKYSFILYFAPKLQTKNIQ